MPTPKEEIRQVLGSLPDDATYEEIQSHIDQKCTRSPTDGEETMIAWFDALSTERQIECVQHLWDRIASDEENIPVPDWQREMLDERLDSRSPEDDVSWEEVKAQLNTKRED
ncbi:MAG: addiction module protein [Bradymonadaceae bacterium]